MKKFSGKVFAGLFVAAVLATSAFAADYSADPNYGKPTSSDVKTADVTAAVTAAANSDTVELEDSGAKLTAEVTKALKDAKKAVEITNGNVTVAISKDEVAKLPETLDLSMGVVELTEETTLANSVKVPKNATMIRPAATGEFGVKVSVSVPVKGLDAAKAKVYHVDDKGVVTEAKDAGLKIVDGIATITIDSASYYVISDGAVTGAKEENNDKEHNVNTGVTLPIALVALAGGSVAVSAIAAKKRK